MQATAFIVPDSLVASSLLGPLRDLDEAALFERVARSANEGTGLRLGGPPIAPPVAGQDDSAQQVILTFARALVAGEDSPAQLPKAGGEPVPVRTHTLTIRAPLVSTARMIWNHDSAPDEDTQRQLLELVRSGDAHIVFHCATTSNSGSRAKIQSIGELIYPAENTGILPAAFETRNVGPQCETETALTADGRSMTTRAEVYHIWPPVWRGLALRPGDSPPEIPVPDFRSSNWRTEFTRTSGETCLVAAISPRREEDESEASTPAWLDVSFIRSVPPDRTPSSSSPATDPLTRRATTNVAVFSVTEETAASLQADAPSVNTPGEAETERGDSIDVMDALWAATATGQARLLAFAQVVQDAGRRGRIDTGREWMYPRALARAETDAECFLPTAWETLQPGTRLEAEVTQGDRSAGGTIKLECACPVADPSFPTTEELRTSLDAKTEVPAPTIHELKVAGEFDFTPGQPQILAIDPSPAPPGHVEHGRWVVTMLKVALRR